MFRDSLNKQNCFMKYKQFDPLEMYKAVEILNVFSLGKLHSGIINLAICVKVGTSFFRIIIYYFQTSKFYCLPLREY